LTIRTIDSALITNHARSPVSLFARPASRLGSGFVLEPAQELQARRSGLSLHHRRDLANAHMKPVATSLLQAKDAHVGVVKSYTAPASPQAPSLPSDLSAELSKFDAAEPALASAPAAATQDVSADAGEGSAGAKEYLAFLEKDLPKADAHH